MSTLMRTVTRTLAFPAMKSCPSFLSTQVRHISFADSPFSRPPRSFDRIDTFDALNTKGFKAQAKTVLSCANPAGVKQNEQKTVTAWSPSLAASSCDACTTDGCKTQAKTFRSSITPAGFKQNDQTTAWSYYAALKIEARAQGDDDMRKKLGFLALAFRDFDVNKNNTIQLEGFRRALSYYRFLEEEQSDSLGNYLDSEFRICWADEVDQCFEAMGPDVDGKINLCQWLDTLPETAIQRLHLHKNAQNWRNGAEYMDDQSFISS